MRKRILDPSGTKTPSRGIDVSTAATVLVTSESEDHPVENAFDDRQGRGGTYWMAGTEGEQTIILEFDEPTIVRRLTLEVEETEVSRTQEIDLAVSTDGGGSYREVVRQEYNFSPSGTTFEREEWRLPEKRATHLRLRIRPDKGGKPCRAKVTSLVIE